MAGEEMATGEIERYLGRLAKGQDDLLARFDSLRAEVVSRTEWDMQNRINAQAFAEAEDKIRTINTELAGHRDTTSRLKGVLWVLGGILGLTVTVIASYIQSGRL